MIGIIGLNHETAGVEIRERFAFDEDEIECLVNELKSKESFDEIVVLSTCNRTEIYFYSPEVCDDRDWEALIRFICGFKKVSDLPKDLFYIYTEEQAVHHLFCVSSGLNSMVLGENQILGQVKEAYRISASKKFTSTVMNRLFSKALQAGKAVRTETAINEGAVSVGTATVELASKIFTDLEKHSVLLLGAGETAEMVLQSLFQRGSQHIHIANRTFEKARELAAHYKAEAVAIGELMQHFIHCDIIITSTSSKEPLIKKDFLREVMRKRQNKSLFIIDLSVPRDIEEKAGKLEELFIFDIDALKGVVDHNHKLRKREIEKAEKIVQLHRDEFFSWLKTLCLKPTILCLKKKFASISDQVYEILKKQTPDDSHPSLQKYGEFLQQKYLRLIIKNLITFSENGRHADYVEMVNKLFELHSPERK